MNCKQGDLAIVIQSRHKNNIGRAITCVSLASAAELHAVLGNYYPDFVHAIWRTDKSFLWTLDNGRGRDIQANFCEDKALMPINPLNDETVEAKDAVKA